MIVLVATVMAGVPVMSTLRSILQSGDRVTAVRGVFSGTLSFVFNSMALEGLGFRDAVLLAKSKGYTEPDVRDDLSGVDFIRKLIVLARVIGLPYATMESVKIKAPLLSPELAALSSEEFMKHGLFKMEAEMKDKVRDPKSERLVFLGEIDIKSGTVSCGLECVSKQSPFGSLAGANNMIVIETELVYSTSPLVISGPGAGASSTAQGILSDLFALGTA